MKNLKDDVKNLEDAGYCRQQLDWMMGINFSVVYTLLTGGDVTLKVGRVVLPTLNLIFEKESEILSFKSSKFFSLKTIFSKMEDSYTGTYIFEEKMNFPEKERLLEVQSAINGKSGSIIKKTESTSNVSPQKLFNLTDLQGYITSKYDGFSADGVLQIMQGLYEIKVLTYPRTASRYLDDSQVYGAQESLNAVKSLFKSGAEIKFHSNKSVFDSSKVDSHPAIIPTYIVPDLSKLSKNENIVYTEVCKRFISQFMPVAGYNNIEMITKIDEHEFITKGKFLLSEGWKSLYSKEDIAEQTEDTQEQVDNLTANFNEKDAVKETKSEVKEKDTQPPKRYTEKSLLTDMENCGKKVTNEESILKGYTIGTPATRAETIKKLLSCGYIEKEGKYLCICELGIKVIAYFPIQRVLKTEFTGKIEKTLKDIENGQYSSKEFMEKMTAYVIKCIQEMKESKIQTISKNENILGQCPDCGKAIIETEKAYSCVGTKDKICKFTIWKDDKYFASLGKKVTEGIVKSLITKGNVLVKDIKSKKDVTKKYDAIISISKDENTGFWKYAMSFLGQR